jgi:Fic family protein
MQRTYERTHPFLRFSADLRAAPVELWILLGEAQSKCEHIAGVALPPEIQKRFNRMYLVKGVQATTAIEGNTLSEQQVQDHLDGKLDLPPSQDYLTKEIDNVLAAVNAIWDDDDGEYAPLTPARVKDFNRRVLSGLDLPPEVVPGECRKHEVGVARYKAAPAADCEYLIDRLCDWLNGPGFAYGDGAQALIAATLKAVLGHLYIAWIHPFADGNGRTARLIEFHILVHAGVPMASAHLLSNHYNSTRAEYYRQLDRASGTGDVIGFALYAIRGFVDQLREQIKVVKDAQLEIAWHKYVHEKFENKNSPTATRQRLLVLALSDHEGKGVPRSQLTSLTPQVAAAYARKTDKTLSRDLNALRDENLIAFRAGLYRARKQIMLAFRPKRKKALGPPAPQNEPVAP